MKYLQFLVAVISLMSDIISAKATYKAAVVEYSPDLETTQSIDRVNKNVNSYIHHMKEAAHQYVDIIVFPEDGLTSWQDITHETVHELSTEVPEPNLGVIPCLTSSDYSKFLVKLSCAASRYKIYTVVNLIERTRDDEKFIYYNTNVVFDRLGRVLARYRKINLFNEPVFSAGDKLVTFETDFGVTFGMFICFDLMFKYPALDVLLVNKSITDVVYSTAWFSELPFYQALSIQHGYAKSTGINLLASGLNNPVTKNGGSGIYLHNGRIAQVYISGIKGSKMIIEDVPKVDKLSIGFSKYKPCQISNVAPSESNLKVPGSPEGQVTEINSFVTSQENLVNYTFKALRMEKDAISETICNGDGFCCSFYITLSRDSNISLNYVYSLIAYYGVSPITTNGSLGLRNCALVACLNEAKESCGGRRKEAPQGVIFESILIKSSFNPLTTHVQPATVTHDLVPTTEYTFCKKENNGKVTVEMQTVKRQQSLLTFGLHGRVFSNDNKPGGVIFNISSSFL